MGMCAVAWAAEHAARPGHQHSVTRWRGAARWLVGHLLPEQLGEEHGAVAVRAGAAGAERAAKAVAVRAAALPEIALVAGRALVDGVGHEVAQPPERGGQGGQVRCGGRTVGVFL